VGDEKAHKAGVPASVDDVKREDAMDDHVDGLAIVEAVGERRRMWASGPGQWERLGRCACWDRVS
jgi:hypothetical protein